MGDYHLALRGKHGELVGIGLSPEREQRRKLSRQQLSPADYKIYQDLMAKAGISEDDYPFKQAHKEWRENAHPYGTLFKPFMKEMISQIQQGGFLN